MRTLSRIVVLCATLGVVAIACSSSGESSTSSTSTSTGGSGSTPASNCQSRCEAKGAQCGSPAADATTKCQSLCGSATEADLKCIEDATCTALAKSDGRCPTGSSSSSSSSSGSSSSSSSGSTGCKIGCLSTADCAACAASDDGTSSYPLCCDKGSGGNPKTCRNRKCCLNFGDECTSDADCCSNSAYKCKANGAKKTCST